MQITQEQLGACIGNNPYLDHWTNALNKLLPDYGIDTPQRVAAFIAQAAHESGGFTALHENLNYRPETLQKVFPKYFSTADLANQYAHNQEAIANRVYANRMGNGDEDSGDGYKFHGRGAIQLTGKANYEAFAKAVEMDLDAAVEYTKTPEGAIMSAGWFWDANHINKISDDIHATSRRINGGDNGLQERIELYEKAKEVLG